MTLKYNPLLSSGLDETGGGGGGGGDVVGPASSTDNTAARWDGATGKLLQDGTVVHTDDGVVQSGTIANLNTPTLSFQGATNAGLSANASNLGFVIGGFRRANLSSVNFHSQTAGSFSIRHQAGSASTPVYAFLNDTDTGIYASSADNLAFSTGGVQAMNIDADGAVTKPLQPRFNAYVSSDVSNVTGDNTTYTIIYDTERYDVGSDYNNASGTYTAPESGTYLFTGSIRAFCGSQTKMLSNLVTSNNTYQIGDGNPNNIKSSSGQILIQYSVSTDMDAGDTCTIQFQVQGGSKDVDIEGDAGSQTWIAGIKIS